VAIGHHPTVPTDTPAREWIAVAFLPSCALILLIGGALEAASTRGGWLVFGCAVLGGLIPAVLYTAVRARQNRLYIRDPAAIERSRARARLAMPAGWVLGAVLLLAISVGGVPRVVALGCAGGIVLGLSLWLFANFMRLRREQWSSVRRSVPAQ
jgi:hypothetical protein